MDEKMNIKEERKVIGGWPSLNGGKIMPRYNTPITPKENFLRFVSKEKKPLWTPVGSDFISIMPNIILDNSARGTIADTVPFDMEKQAGGPDLFGVEWKYVSKVGGSTVVPGSPKVPDINHWEDYISMPDLDALDWEGASERLKTYYETDRVNQTIIYTGLFERLISLVDFAEAATALIDEDQQDAVHRLFNHLCIVYDGMLKRFRKYFKIDLVTFHDDWGSQKDAFFSPRTCQEMLVPYLKRVVDSAHSYGIVLNFHSCGKSERLVPCMVEAGVDLWSGQNLNNWEELLKIYEGKIIFHIAPSKFNPEEETEEEFVRRAVDYWKKYSDSDSVYAEPLRGLFSKIPDEYYWQIYMLSREKYAATR